MGSDRFDWERALMASGLPSGRKLVLLVLATYVNRHGVAFPTQVQLADACGMKERAIRGHLSAAIEEGWIERLRVGRSGVASEYRLRLSTGTDTTGKDVPPPTGTGEPVDESQPANNDSQPASDDTSTGTPVPTNTYQHVDTTPRSNAPLNVHLSAIKFGKAMAGLAEDPDALRRMFDADRSLHCFPDLFDVVLDHWLRATGQRSDDDAEETA